MASRHAFDVLSLIGSAPTWNLIQDAPRAIHDQRRERRDSALFQAWGWGRAPKATSCVGCVPCFRRLSLGSPAPLIDTPWMDVWMWNDVTAAVVHVHSCLVSWPRSEVQTCSSCASYSVRSSCLYMPAGAPREAEERSSRRARPVLTAWRVYCHEPVHDADNACVRLSGRCTVHSVSRSSLSEPSAPARRRGRPARRASARRPDKHR